MTYASVVWHAPNEIKATPKALENKLAVIQNKCLRSIAGAFKATPVQSLEAETYVAPMPIHLNQLQAKGRLRLNASGQTAFIRTSSRRIKRKLETGTGRKRKTVETPGERKQAWAKKIMPAAQWANAQTLAAKPPWRDFTDAEAAANTEAKQRRQKQEKEADAHFAAEWGKHWEKYQAKHSLDPTAAQAGRLARERTHIHKGLAKAKSALATQIRTETIGFASFFHRRRVPGVESAACHCGHPNQTAKHVIMFCRLNDIKERLPNVRISDDYRRLVNDHKSLKIITSLLMRTGYLGQFSTAVQQLYNQ